MSDTRVKQHPTLGILVCTDGHVMVPQSGTHPARWTFGSKDGWGYKHVGISGKSYKVHRLIAETFLGEIPEGFDVDHINRIKDDNRVENLRIVTHRENMRNMPPHDRVTERGGTHYYQDERQFKRELQDLYRQAKHKTHRQVRFSDNSLRWIPLTEANELLKIPWKKRVFKR